jgi:UDP-glucose 4-epimerase
MSTIVITGGAGFIGSHLAERCVREGHRVIIIDNLSRGKKQNLSSVRKQIEWYHEPVLSLDELPSVIRRADYVFHLAALSRVIPSIRDPESCFVNNTQTTERIARLCAEYKKILIFSSSREVYGQAAYYPVDENHPLNPENPYGASKAAGELIVRSYAGSYHLRYGIFRLANVYGPRDFDRVIPIFIKNCLKNKDLTIYGGKQVIDFVFIHDVVDALYRSLSCEKNFIVNIGSGKGTNILDVANTIRDLVQSRNEIQMKEERTGEVEKFISDPTRAKTTLHWSPKTKFEKGLKTTIASFDHEH